uniref:Uncharacterized protein n=1 Tax=Rhizophora mucronata TaxID=61149 RepID=A0A2P2QIJ0_RHIMU
MSTYGMRMNYEQSAKDTCCHCCDCHASALFPELLQASGRNSQLKSTIAPAYYF